MQEQQQAYKIVNADEAQKGDIIFMPNGVAGFPSDWVKWRVVKTTKETIQIRNGRAGAYIKTDCTVKKIKTDGTPQKVCILLY